jgi:hypothetical protein
MNGFFPACFGSLSKVSSGWDHCRFCHSTHHIVFTAMRPFFISILPTLACTLSLTPSVHGAVVLSNVAELNHLSATVDNNFMVAESFVAGATATFDAVTLQVSLNPPSAGLGLKLYADVSGSPAASALANLQLDSGARFTPIAPLTLSAGTTYWVVATAAAPQVSWDGTSSVNETGASGWTIGNDHREKGFSNPWGTVSDSLKMTIEATAVPEPATVGVISGLGLLGLAGFRRVTSKRNR